MKPRALAYPDLILFNGKIRSFAAVIRSMRHWRAPAGASLQPANPTTSGAWLALTRNPSISRVERRSRGLRTPTFTSPKKAPRRWS